MPAKHRTAAARAASSATGRKTSGAKRANGGRSVAAPGKPGRIRRDDRGFVDARRMPSEDVVTKTLRETSGVLGIPTRPKVIDFNARLKEKRKAGTRVIALRAAAAVAVVAAVCSLVWLLFFSPVLRLETGEISVTGGNEWVSRSEILAIADKQSGKSLLLVSAKDVKAQLTNIPGVTEADVTKRYPHGMAVKISAQQPAAMLKTSDSQMVAVDSKARVLNTVGHTSTKGIPVIEVKDVDASLENKSVKEALKVLGGLPDAMRTSITKVTASTQDSITTEFNGGEHVVVWGDSSDLELKVAIVDKILSAPNVIGDKTQVDVSAPSRPIIK
ncbi:cell division protein FtsQ/DivIB [Bifidobacterium biavatii]|nr:FtsQ-type POTRA domain-containing protein [Bifidobacterium biavatii]